MLNYAEGQYCNNRIQFRKEEGSARLGIGNIKRVGLLALNLLERARTNHQSAIDNLRGSELATDRKRPAFALASWGRREATGKTRRQDTKCVKTAPVSIGTLLLLIGVCLPSVATEGRGATFMIAADYVRDFREISLTSSPTMTIRDSFDYGAISKGDEMLFARDRWYTITSLVGGEMGARVVNADAQMSWFFGVEVYDATSWEKVGSAFSSGGVATVTWMSELDRVYWVRVYGEAFQTRYDLTMEAEGVPVRDGVGSGSEINKGLGASVVGRHLFYNNSGFDGESAAANAADDNAIAPDKSALLPGGVATFENYSSYDRGINGVMIDVAGLSGTPTLDDFQFRQGNSDDLATWTTGRSPSSITVRAGAGVSGSDRITLIWDDPVIGEEPGANSATHRSWLEVVVKSGGNIGLASADTFYFGSAPGDTGDRATDAVVSTADMLRIRINRRSLINPADLNDAFDINRDRKVGTMDMLLARLYRTTLIDGLRLLDLSSSPSGDAVLASESLSRRSAPVSPDSAPDSDIGAQEVDSWGAKITVEAGKPVLTFQGREGAEYNVQWCSAIGEEWRPLTSEVVERAPGQYQISGESLVGSSVFFRINLVQEIEALAAF